MMDPKKMGKQMIDFYKTSFDNSFSAMMMLQEQMERMTNMYWGQMVNLPDEAKKGLAEWTKSYKKNCEDFKKMMDESFKKLESFVAETEKSEKMAKSA
ncbi:MAG: hypothetical protein WC600_03845 [Desulfobaccales bacterium]